MCESVTTTNVAVQGICAVCNQIVDLVDYPADPDDAQYITDYYDCADHNGPDGEPCTGSGHSPSSIPELETRWDDDETILTMGDVDPGGI